MQTVDFKHGRIRHSRRLTPLLVLAMLLAMALQIAASVHGESVSWDEGDHLFAGYMSLRTHDYGLNPEHPPMVKMLAAFPLQFMDLKTPPLQNRYFKTEAYLDGRELIFRNAPQYGGRYTARQIMWRARLPLLIFPLVMALTVFFCAREMFGQGAALLAMLLAVTDPNLLAHGPFVATDSAASCTFLLAVYLFYRFCRRPASPRLLATGIAGGFALAAKHSTVFLLPMFVLLIAVEVWLRRSERQNAGGPPGTVRRDLIHLTGALAVLVAVAVAVLWCFYGWRFAARPAGLALNPSLAAACSQIRPIEGRILLGIARLRLLPESYLYGLADIRNVANTWPSYLFGHVYAHGVPWYFPASLLIKSTLCELFLLALTAFAIASGRLRHRREVLFLAIPMAIYLAAGMESGLNIGMRHVLPLYPLAIVLVAGGAAAMARSARPWGYAIALAVLVFQGASSLHAFPNYIPYSNEAFGGPSNTGKYLTDSSVDWGQQLLAVKQYTDANNIHDCWFAYFVDPFVQPKDYGIPCRTLPTWDNIGTGAVHPVPPVLEGTVLISQGDLTGYEYRSAVLNPLAPFRDRKPVALIQDGVFVYRGRFQVPLLASMSHLVLSRNALAKKDFATAIREGEAAVSLAPEGVEQQEILGDALRAAGRTSQAAPHYQAALRRVLRDMEPSAQQIWEPQLRAKLRAP